MVTDIEQENRQAFSNRFNAILDLAGVDKKWKGRQEAVGKMFGVSGKAARKWLEGEGYPTFSKLILIVEKLKSTGVTIEWLLTGNDAYSPFRSDRGNCTYPSYMDYPEDYRLSVIYACYDLINEGIYPDTEESKMELFFRSADIVREFNKPDTDFIKEALKQKALKKPKN
ncbi:MAG: hypothetical protein ACXW0Q_07395 [Methylovulum sp.]